MSMKNYDNFGKWTHDLLACTTVPPATVVQHAPFDYWYFIKFLKPNMCGLHWTQILLSWLLWQS